MYNFCLYVGARNCNRSSHFNQKHLQNVCIKYIQLQVITLNHLNQKQFCNITQLNRQFLLILRFIMEHTLRAHIAIIVRLSSLLIIQTWKPALFVNASICLQLTILR